MSPMSLPSIVGMTLQVLLACLLSGSLVGGSNHVLGQWRGEAPEPFSELHSHNAEGGPPRPSSPDPLVRYTWSFPDGKNESQQLQIYRVDRPVAFDVFPAAAMTGTDSLDPKFAGQPLQLQVQPHVSGYLRLDWGVERAAWFELISPDVPTSNHNQDNNNNTYPVPSATAAVVTASVSEFNVPQKTQPLTKYGQSTYRLETNPELYEGCRYTWIHFESSDQPWHISQLSLVAKIKPVAYTGSFASSDDTLTQVWYAGAYGVRLNMEQDAFNSVLVERGDRVSIQGDGHPTMATSLVAFGGSGVYDLVYDMLVQTNSGTVHGHYVVDQGIKPYPIYWTMSVNDWFMASGNTAGFLQLADDVMSIIDQRINDFLSPSLDLVWMGWDDRLGDGWCSDAGGCGREAQLAFAALLVRACWDVGTSLILAGRVGDGQRYQATARRLGAQLRHVPEWPQGFGLHASANVLNAKGLIASSQQDVDTLFDNAMNDAVTACSLSNFNQYWNLQAYGNANKMEHALASIQLCWGTQLDLGKGCFWELYSIYWFPWMNDGDQAPVGISYCHPWASGATAWMSHVLGGLQPLLPGYAEFVAAPYVSGRYPRVEAAVPTPYGSLAVQAQLDCSPSYMRTSQQPTPQHCNMKMTLNAAMPGFVGIRTRLFSGDDENDPSDCSLDADSIIWNGRLTRARSTQDIVVSSKNVTSGHLQLIKHFSPAVAADLVFLRVNENGNKGLAHSIVVTYRGNCNSTRHSDPAKTENGDKNRTIPHFPPFPVPQYPATNYLDTVSSGDGLLDRGSDGFVLFGYQSNASDYVKLPPYVSNVTVHNHDYNGWHNTLERSFVGSSTTNRTYLPLGSDRALGMVGEDFYRGLGRGMIIDVDFVESVQVGIQVSIYCVAKFPDDKHFIRVQDAVSRAVIAPSVLVSNYSGGTWSTLRYSKSFRVRLMSVHGVHVSAVAFAKAHATDSIDSALPAVVEE